MRLESHPTVIAPRQTANGSGVLSITRLSVAVNSISCKQFPGETADGPTEQALPVPDGLSPPKAARGPARTPFGAVRAGKPPHCSGRTVHCQRTGSQPGVMFVTSAWMCGNARAAVSYRGMGQTGDTHGKQRKRPPFLHVAGSQCQQQGCPVQVHYHSTWRERTSDFRR